MRRAGLLDLEAIRAAACAGELPGETLSRARDCPIGLNVGKKRSPAFEGCFSIPGGGRPLEYAAKLAVVVFVAFCIGFAGIGSGRALPAAAAANLALEDAEFVGCDVFIAVFG